MVSAGLGMCLHKQKIVISFLKLGNTWDYENHRDVFFIIGISISIFHNHDCVPVPSTSVHN